MAVYPACLLCRWVKRNPVVLVPIKMSVIEKLKNLAEETVLKHGDGRDPFSYPLPAYVLKNNRYEDYFRYLLIKCLSLTCSS